MNPRPNNPNLEFNPFSYDPESLRNFYAQLQQNPNFQHFQPNFQPPPNFQPGFAAFSQPRFESDFVSPSQPENAVVPETQDTLKRKKDKKNKQPAGAGPSSGPMTPKQWTPDEENRSRKMLHGRIREQNQSNCANNRKSGMSDENVLKWAEKEYQLKSNGQTFNHYHVWVAIKDSPKFRVLCQEDYEWGMVFSGVTIVGVKGFQWGDDVAGNFSGKGFQWSDRYG
ncbi:hypothetical protein R6Q57_021136 [Mikania cordata]